MRDADTGIRNRTPDQEIKKLFLYSVSEEPQKDMREKLRQLGEDEYGHAEIQPEDATQGREQGGNILKEIWFVCSSSEDKHWKGEY